MRHCFCRHRFIFYILSCLLSLEVVAQATPKPLWAIKGVKHLNEHRINRDYDFVAFHHEITDQDVVIDDNLFLLRQNMAEHFNVSPDVISIDSIVDNSLCRPTYSVSFPSNDKKDITKVYVQPVDSYQRFSNNIDGSFDYDLDELYAISEKNTTPSFDNFEVTRKYNGLPVAMSLIPGLGQIYKGQAAKGYSILGTEVFFCAAIAYGEINRSYYLKQGKKHPETYDSWKSKSNTFRTVRNIGIVLASATYLYNIFDAAFAKGAPHVIISRKNQCPADMVLTSYVSPWQLGGGITINF